MLDRRDIFHWDTVNWSICLPLWEPEVSAGPCDCLEIGSGPGGLSLWLAAKGHNVICSDRSPPGPAVRELHHRHGVAQRIQYETIDANEIPYSDRFDVIIFKSVLGSIWANGGPEGLRRPLRQIHKALKAKGRLLFAENLRATALHMYCRKRFLNRTEASWRYPRIHDVLSALGEDWANVRYRTTGFLGTFGRSERQRSALGYIDKVITPCLPRSWHYVMAGVAIK